MLDVLPDLQRADGGCEAPVAQACAYPQAGFDHKVTAPGPRDGRFRTLLGAARWQQLPDAVQERFSKPRNSKSATVYSGYVAETRLSKAGRVLAGLLRVIGSPLPLAPSGVVPAVVSVIDDGVASVQHWTRVYARPGAFPQVVHSSKRFSGPTGLEEYVGYGIGMTLHLDVEGGALRFTSGQYFVCVGQWRLYLPAVVTPGQMTITHQAERDDWFSFRLTLAHPLFGELLCQLAYFREA